jgi:hypothetical protein
MAFRDAPRMRNQMRFREANARLHDAVQDGGREPRRVAFLCECADDDCVERVDVTLADWEAVASAHNHFLMIAGHQRSDDEEVVGSLGKFEIARKPD